MSKCRGFSIVLHDVHMGLQTKDEVHEKVKTLLFRQYVIAEEPYGHQDGSHINVFIQLKNPVYFTAQLKLWCTWWKAGRVQVDAMKGTMVQACKYLLKDYTKKDKTTDDSPIIYMDNNDDRVATGQEMVSYATLDEIFFGTMSKLNLCTGQGAIVDWKALLSPLFTPSSPG